MVDGKLDVVAIGKVFGKDGRLAGHRGRFLREGWVGATL
jgi:hypothetical protein